MILSRNQAHGALFLVLAFAALGGLFGLLGAPFVAVVQIIVYAGAIMVLFIFVIMMINRREAGIPREKRKLDRWSAAVVLALVLLAEIAPGRPRPAVSRRGRRRRRRSTPADLGRLSVHELSLSLRDHLRS